LIFNCLSYYFRSRGSYLIILIFICAGILLFSCKTQLMPDKGLTEQRESGKIIFLNFSIIHDKIKQEYSCRLINQKTVNGKAKEIRSDNDSAYYQNYLLCNFTDEKGNIKLTSVLEHPLFKTVEYQDENGKLSLKQLNLDSAQFSLRVNKLPDMSSVQILQVINKNTPEKLTNIKLQ
jgi:hypothetical protein